MAMNSIVRSRITTATMAALISALLLSTAIAFAPVVPTTTSHLAHSSRPLVAQPSPLSTFLPMSLTDVSDFYATNPLEAAVLTCGVKASVADGIAQVRAIVAGDTNSNDANVDDANGRSTMSIQSLWNDLEFRRNLAYILYGGIFIGALCHYEYDIIFPQLFGTQHSLLTSLKEVLFDNFVSAPLMWLPPAYLIKALVYDYSMMEGLQKYYDDVTKEGLLTKYWTIWVPAQSISFTVVPDHMRIVFMASVSFFWFILFSTISSPTSSSSESSIISDETEASA